MKINYCIGTWSGTRARIPFDDSFIRRHIDHLNTLQHQIDQITIGHPENPDETPEYTKYLRSLTSLDTGTPIVVHDTPNQGMSYGQWSRIFLKYRNQFTHYLFIEDDYVPMLDDFDSIMARMLEQKGCGYLCGLMLDQSGRFGIKKVCHAAISNGIATSETLQSIVDQQGHLTPETPAPRGFMGEDQVRFSVYITKSGFSIDDYSDQFASPYYSFNNNLRIYGPGKLNLIVPLQCFEDRLWNIDAFYVNGRKNSFKNTPFNPRVPFESHPNQGSRR